MQNLCPVERHSGINCQTAVNTNANNGGRNYAVSFFVRATERTRVISKLLQNQHAEQTCFNELEIKCFFYVFLQL